MMPGAMKARVMIRSFQRLVSLLLVAVGVTGTPAFGAPDKDLERVDPASRYCAQENLGYWFYCSKPSRKKPERTQTSTPPAPAQQTATEQVEAIQEQLTELRARAVLEPTKENVLAYQQFQFQQVERASVFSDVWRRNVWTNPDIDYSLRRPTNTLAVQSFLDQRKLHKTAAMADISQRYGVFYFFSGACPVCKQFSPILRTVTRTYGINVLAVSTDGTPSEAFPNYRVESGHRMRMGIESGPVPLVVLFDAQTNDVIPVGYGMMAADELVDRLYVLTQTKPGEDY